MHFLSSVTRSASYRSGQATLSLVVLIGGISILTALSLSFLSISFLNIGSGFEAGERAFAVARAGVDDAILQLARNENDSRTSPRSYIISVGDFATFVEIVPNGNQALITSTATVLARTKKIQTLVSVNSVSGTVTQISTSLIQ
jgi:hypothetical protein